MNALDLVEEAPVPGYKEVYSWNFRGIAGIRLTSLAKRTLDIGEGLSTIVYTNYMDGKVLPEHIQTEENSECFACVTHAPHTKGFHKTLIVDRPMAGFTAQSSANSQYYYVMRWVNALPVYYDAAGEAYRVDGRDTTRLVNRIAVQLSEEEKCQMCRKNRRHSLQLHAELGRWK